MGMNFYGKLYSEDTLQSMSQKKIFQYGIQQLYKFFSFCKSPIVDVKHHQFFEKLWELRIYKKNSLLVSNGEANDSIFFIISGSIRFFNKVHNEEHTLMLLSEGNFVFDINDATHDPKSIINIATCQKTYILEMSKANFDLYMQSEYRPFFESTQNYLIKNYYVYLHQIMVILRLRSLDKVKALFEINAELFKTVQGKYIACFLDLKTETLSRVRHKLAIPANNPKNAN